MKHIAGKALYYTMLPFVAVGAIAWVIAAALQLGWDKAHECVTNWHR
jgi:hypothetical protein